MTSDPTATQLLQPNDFECISRAVFGEARGEGPEGMALVVQTIVNRHKVQGRDGCWHVRRAYDGYRLWEHRDPMKANREKWYEAQLITLAVVMGETDLGRCESATHFLNPQAVSRMPNWANANNQVCTVGKHVAYHIKNI